MQENIEFLKRIIAYAAPETIEDYEEAVLILGKLQAAVVALELFLDRYHNHAGKLPEIGGDEHEEYRKLADAIDKYKNFKA